MTKKRKESVGEFLARGGKITSIPFGVSGETARAVRADSSRLRWDDDTNHKTVFTKDNLRGKQ